MDAGGQHIADRACRAALARSVARSYVAVTQPALVPLGQCLMPSLAAFALLVALAVHLVGPALSLVIAAGVISAGAWALAGRLAAPPAVDNGVTLLAGIGGLPVLVLALYYFGHRPDWDDANYINLASGAQRSAAPICAVDTMLGDGPYAIHLPTYRIQSFELLGAALSSITGLAPIAAVHLQLVLAALVLALTLIPALGRDWLAGAVSRLPSSMPIVRCWAVGGCTASRASSRARGV